MSNRVQHPGFGASVSLSPDPVAAGGIEGTVVSNRLESTGQGQTPSAEQLAPGERGSPRRVCFWHSRLAGPHRGSGERHRPHDPAVHPMPRHRVRHELWCPHRHHEQRCRAITDSSQGPYDGSDDTLFGIQNDTSQTVSSVSIASHVQIYGFDGDGICHYTFTGDSYCSSLPTGSRETKVQPRRSRTSTRPRPSASLPLAPASRPVLGRTSTSKHRGLAPRSRFNLPCKTRRPAPASPPAWVRCTPPAVRADGDPSTVQVAISGTPSPTCRCPDVAPLSTSPAPTTPWATPPRASLATAGPLPTTCTWW